MLIPTISSIVLSFTDFNMVQIPHFVGVDNYLRLLFSDKIFILSFVLSLCFSFIAEIVSSLNSVIFAIIMIVILLTINTISDIIATAVTSCDIEPFLAMASKKKKGAKTAVWIVKNADKVSNICADVIGDICGIVSGAVGVTLVVYLTVLNSATYFETLVTVLVSALISAFTIGGKALGKSYAMNNSVKVVYRIARILSIFTKG